LEDLPNKITTILGIVADVNLHENEQGDYIEIIVEPQTNPANDKAEYHYRSGATNRTATFDLKELVENFNILKISAAGASTFYHI